LWDRNRIEREGREGERGREEGREGRGKGERRGRIEKESEEKDSVITSEDLEGFR